MASPLPLKTFYIVVAVLFYCEVTYAAKILVLPQNIPSHIGYHSRLADILSAKEFGHKVGILLPSNAKVASHLLQSNVEVVKYQVPSSTSVLNSKEMSEIILDIAFASSLYEKYQLTNKMLMIMFEGLDEECAALFDSEVVRKHVVETGYDVVIMDVAGTICKMAYPISLDIPVILYGVMPFKWADRIPALPSFVPSEMSTYSDQMTFMERVYNTLLYLILDSVRLTNFMYDAYERRVSKGILDKIGDVHSVGSHALMFQMDDIALSYPQPIMPNVVHVVDVMTRPAEPLEATLLEFIESAPEGVILVSFGSFFDYMPPELVDKFCRAFSNVPQKVIWKLKEKTQCVVDATNILTMGWIPQNDILGHANVKLFVSHAGVSGYVEAVYHATPLLAVPIALDQPYNAGRIFNKGFGLNLDIKEFTEEELISKISTIIHNATFAENIRKGSLILRDKPQSVGERTSYWINHYLKHGSDHLKTGAYKLNLIEFLMIDVFALFFVVTCVILVILVCCLKYCYRGFRGCCRNGKKVKAE